MAAFSQDKPNDYGSHPLQACKEPQLEGEQVLKPLTWGTQWVALQIHFCSWLRYQAELTVYTNFCIK